jgi:Flp pilus assembly protein TadG
MIRRLLRDETGGPAAEFALVVPFLVFILLLIVDVGRWLMFYNQAQKATQMGARFAVVTTPVSNAVANTDYVGSCSPALTQGDVIPASCFSTITCTSASCSSGTLNTTAFNKIRDRMRYFIPKLQAANMVVRYSPSGLGYAGNPNGPDISPIVTVEIGDPATPLTFRLISTVNAAAINMPKFTTSLTAEDAVGNQSN